MNTQHRILRPSPPDLSRVYDEARYRAAELRAQAVDDFWRGAAAALRAQMSNVRRAVTRLWQRPPHHQTLHGTAAR